MKIKVMVVAGLVLAAVVAIILNRRASSFDALQAPGQPSDGPRVPVLVELFTSEGCSSCPPADEVLRRLGAQPIGGAEVIVLSEHVDYWNRLGWADPFSSAQFSERQSQYAGVLHLDDVYTPQMVVDGREEFVGSNAGRARQVVEAAVRQPKAQIKVSLAAPSRTGGVSIAVEVAELPQNSEADRADVLLAVTEDDLRSEVSRGENSGRNLSHTGVVRRLVNIGAVGNADSERPFSTTTTLPIDRGWRRDHLKAVVFVQDPGSRRVLGVAAISLARE
jgi:hypothetical protein